MPTTNPEPANHVPWNALSVSPLDPTETVPDVTKVTSLKDTSVDQLAQKVNMPTPKPELVNLVTTLVPLAPDQTLTNVLLVSIQTISTTADVETHVQTVIPEEILTEPVDLATPLV
jgi:hypothetical protein